MEKQKITPWIPIACALGLLNLANAAPPAPAADVMTSALTREALARPEVAVAIESSIRDGNAANVPPEARSMIEVQPVAVQDPRLARRMGVDFDIGAPLGVGAEFTYNVIAPITLGAGLHTTAATYAITAEATVNILPIFMNSKWTPTVSVAFHHIRFTGVSNDMIDKMNPYLARQGIDVDMRGAWMNMVSVMGGIDYVATGGFHFNASAGYIRQLGESGGQDSENGVVLRNWGSFIVNFGVGYRF